MEDDWGFGDEHTKTAACPIRVEAVDDTEWGFGPDISNLTLQTSQVTLPTKKSLYVVSERTEDDWGFGAQASLVPRLASTELARAIKNYDVDGLRALINAGANAQIRDYEDNNLLHYLATLDFNERPATISWEWDSVLTRTRAIVRLLVDHGVAIEAVSKIIRPRGNRAGFTPIEATIYKPALRLSLGKKIRVDTSHFMYGNSHILMALLQEGANLRPSQAKYRNSLFFEWAILPQERTSFPTKHKDILRLLIARADNLNEEYIFGSNLIHMLFDKGIAYDLSDDQRQRTLSIIIGASNNERPFDIDSRSSTMGWTALMTVARTGSPDFKMLLTAGADPHIIDEDGRSLLDVVLSPPPRRIDTDTALHIREITHTIANLRSKYEMAMLRRAVKDQTLASLAFHGQLETIQCLLDDGWPKEVNRIITCNPRAGHFNGNDHEHVVTGTVLDFAFYGAQESRAQTLGLLQNCFTSAERDYIFGFFGPYDDKTPMRHQIMIRQDAYQKYPKLLQVLHEAGFTRQKPANVLNEPSFFDALNLAEYQVTKETQPHHKHWETLYEFELLEPGWEEQALQMLLSRYSNFDGSMAKEPPAYKWPADHHFPDPQEDFNELSSTELIEYSLSLTLPPAGILLRFPQLQDLLPNIKYDQDWLLVTVVPDNWTSTKEHHSRIYRTLFRRRRKVVKIKLENGQIVRMMDLEGRVLDPQRR